MQSKLMRELWNEPPKPGTHENHFKYNRRRARQQLIEALSRDIDWWDTHYQNECRTTYREGNDA